MECSRGIAMGILSVCPSVRLSVKRVHCDKTEESYVWKANWSLKVRLGGGLRSDGYTVCSKKVTPK